MAKYPYIVNKNGVWYPSGAEVPESARTSKNITADEKAETKENQYTKTDINRMSTAELKALAKEQGIENAKDMTGGELKKNLIEEFGL